MLNKADNNHSQRNAFEETARAVDADKSDDALDRIMGKLDLKKRPEKKEADDGKSS